MSADANYYYYNMKWDDFFTTTVSSGCISSPDNFFEKYYDIRPSSAKSWTYEPAPIGYFRLQFEKTGQNNDFYVTLKFSTNGDGSVDDLYLPLT